MSDPNAPRAEGSDPAEQSSNAELSSNVERPASTEPPVDGFAVTDEQHAAPSAPAAPGVGEPAQSFSSPAVDPAAPAQFGSAADAGPTAPGQPAFGSIDGAQSWQRPAAGQFGAGEPGSPGQAPASGQGSSAPSYGQAGSAPSYGQPGASGNAQPGHGAPGAGPQQPVGQPGQPPYGQPGQQQYGQPQYGAPGQPQYPASVPMSPIDEKNAGMWGHLSGLSTIVTGGYGGWIGPLIVFLIYKDRSAFARQESKEALNFGILMTIATLGLLVLGTILSIVGIGFILLALWWVPGLLQVIFSIIGAMRVNAGGSYRYPFNWRIVQ